MVLCYDRLSNCSSWRVADCCSQTAHRKLNHHTLKTEKKSVTLTALLSSLGAVATEAASQETLGHAFHAASLPYRSLQPARRSWRATGRRVSRDRLGWRQQLVSSSLRTGEGDELLLEKIHLRFDGLRAA